MKLSDFSEIELIGRISRKIKLFSKDIAKGIGDDAAVVNYNKQYYLLLTTDSLVENVHFSKFFTPEQIGMKAIEINVSDIAAMGGFPKYALVSLIIPKNIDINFIDKLYDGINKAVKKYEISVIGGNLSNGKEISATIAMLGFVEKKNLRLRSDAKANDLIAVTGNLGASAAGLQLLKAKMKGSSINYHLNPKSKLNAARLLAKYGINAMEDISDGLAAEVRNICNESKVGAVIYKEKIPINKDAIIDSKKLNRDPYDLALYGGEDFELIFTMNKNSFKKLNKLNKMKNKKNAQKLTISGTNYIGIGKNKLDFTIIGKILPKKDGVFLLDKNKKIILSHGYEHFKHN